MKRTTILGPVLIAFVMGALVSGRLLTAEAEQPAPPAPADCEHTLAKREQELRAARTAATGAADREKAARAEAASGARETQRKILELLIAAKREGKTIAGYGAPGKGNTLLNYCGIRQDFIDFTVARNPYKHGRYLPGTHIPVVLGSFSRSEIGLRLGLDINRARQPTT